MKNNNLDLNKLKKQLNQLSKVGAKHIAFVGVMIVLITYLFVVWNISKLSVAEPSGDDSASIQTHIPKIDKAAIDQIQSLEQNNTDIHSLFNDARNNPFQE